MESEDALPGDSRMLHRPLIPDVWRGKVYRVPVISMFYGVIVSLYFHDNRRHHRPHIHAKYQNDEAVIGIPEGEVLEGTLCLEVR